SDRLIVINTYHPPVHEIVLDKQWVGGAMTQAEAEFTLYQNGNAYEYRVHEIDPPEGYVVQYSEDGLEIFNKYQGDVSSIQK
ncbi:hypothetical protein PT076_08880, partial [Erysipelothrix rhusiopathiae]|nr:hypothetical protein [Erysipelothrix rhusiopathiae]